MMEVFFMYNALSDKSKYKVVQLNVLSPLVLILYGPYQCRLHGSFDVIWSIDAFAKVLQLAFELYDESDLSFALAREGKLDGKCD